MFEELDIMSEKFAVFSNNGSITYANLNHSAGELKVLLGEKKCCILLISGKCNSVELIMFYYSCLVDKYVPYIVEETISLKDIIKLCRQFRFKYIICRKQIGQKLNYRIIYEQNGWLILKTEVSCENINPELAVLMTTSGSTGYSKCVGHSYNNLHNATLKYTQICGISEDDRGLLILPLTFCFGQLQLLMSLANQTTIFISDKDIFESEFWEFYVNSRITYFFCTPFLLKQLQRFNYDEKNKGTLRVVCQGGGIPNVSSLKALKKIENLHLFNVYAQTECLIISSHELTVDTDTPMNCVGIPLENINFSKEGIIIVNGPETLGYAKSYKDLISVVKSNTIDTGDIGKIDENGRLYILGRKKRFSKIAGIRISHEDIECEVEQYFNTEVICVGNDNELALFLTKASNINEIQKFVSEWIKISNIFIKVYIIDDLPHLSNGKKDYFSINKLWEKYKISM